MADARCLEIEIDVSDVVNEDAKLFMDDYWPGWSCSFYRCDHYRLAEENSHAWCWLRHGIGAEGREAECPGYKRAVRIQLKPPNAQVTGRPPDKGGESDELGERDGR